MKGMLKWFVIALVPFLVFSCRAQTQDTADKNKTEPQSTVLSPLETVRSLAKENAANTGRSNIDSHPREIKAILDRGYIVFAMADQNQKPFNYLDEQTGELIGADVEIAYAIANRMGVRAVFNRTTTSFDELVMKVVKGEVDVALSKLSLTSRRAELVRFTSPYIVFRQALLINRLEFAKIGTEEQLPQFIRNYNGSLGVIKNSSYVNYALANFPNADIQTFDNWALALDALFKGKILGVYRDEGEVLIVNAVRKDASILLKPVFINDKRDPIAMAVSADAPLLQEWLNVFLDEYLLQNRQQLTPGKLVKRHFLGN